MDKIFLFITKIINVLMMNTKGNTTGQRNMTQSLNITLNSKINIIKIKDSVQLSRIN